MICNITPTCSAGLIDLRRISGFELEIQDDTWDQVVTRFIRPVTTIEIFHNWVQIKLIIRVHILKFDTLFFNLRDFSIITNKPL